MRSFSKIIYEKRAQRHSKLRVREFLPLILATPTSSIDMKTKDLLPLILADHQLDKAHRDKATIMDGLHKSAFLSRKKVVVGSVVLEVRRSSPTSNVVATWVDGMNLCRVCQMMDLVGTSLHFRRLGDDRSSLVVAMMAGLVLLHFVIKDSMPSNFIALRS
jgi:hypothetical protein